MRVFVAGATGVLGRATVPRLVAAGHEVVALARTPDRANRLQAQGAEPRTADLFDAAAVRAALDGCEAVVHMATSIPPIGRAWRASAWATNDRLRREGTRILVDAAEAVGATVLVKETVCFFYPDSGSAWIDEDVPVVRRPFSAASIDAEETTTAFTADGRRGVVLRFGLFYSADSRSTAENLRMARFGLGPMIGLADSYQSSIHVEDAGAAVVAALDVPAGTYNVADEPITNGAWNAAFAQAFGTRRLRPTPRWAMRLGGKKLEVLGASRRVSSTRFRDASGWTPAYPDATVGLPVVAAAYREGGV